MKQTKQTSIPESKIIFITGTDTGVGKTLLTALLLADLRQTGRCALALKPFSSGERHDAELLHQLQGGGLTLDQINPFHFPEAIAPFVAARKHRRKIQLETVLAHIRSVLSRPLSAIQNPKSKIQNSCLLIEGAGGLLAPLGERYTNLDLIRNLHCKTIVVAPNQLGTINHTWLTVRALQSQTSTLIRHSPITCVLMNLLHADLSSRSNAAVLSDLLNPVPVFSLPHIAGLTALMPTPNCITQIRRSSRGLRNILRALVS